jgi:hypothetical protein
MLPKIVEKTKFLKNAVTFLKIVEHFYLRVMRWAGGKLKVIQLGGFLVG